MGSRARVAALTGGGADVWMSTSSLRKRLGLMVDGPPRRWVIGQAAYGCDAASQSAVEHGGYKHVTPFARLMGLLRPERHDIWVILVFSVVVGILALAAPIAVEALVNTVAFGRYLQPVVVLAVLLFTFLAFAAAIRGLITYVVEIIQRRLFIRVVEDLAYRLPRVRQQALVDEYGPELANRFFDVVTVQKVVASLLLDGVAIVLQTVIGMVVLAFYHPFLLGFDLVLLLFIGLIVFGLGHGAVRTAVRNRGRNMHWRPGCRNSSAGRPRSSCMRGSQFATGSRGSTGWRMARCPASPFPHLDAADPVRVGVAGGGRDRPAGIGRLAGDTGELTLGQLVAAELIVMVIVGSFAKLGKQLENFYDLLAAVEKLGHLFDLPTEPHDKLFHLREGMPAHVRVCDVLARSDRKKPWGS